MTNHFFSIVIPTLNEEEYLPKLLEDLVEQSVKNFEVIVVDGGSKDKTIEKAKKYEDQLSITVLKSPKANVGFQRNLGAKSAKGEWIIFFDADVEIPHRFLSELHKQIIATTPDFATTYIKTNGYRPYDNAISRFTNIAMEICLMIDRPVILGCGFMVKKSVFDKSGGFDPKIKFAEDWEYAERLFRSNFHMEIYKTPRLIFSLRRFYHEGRVKALRKTALAATYVLTKGHITRELFDYKMGGGWYKLKAKSQIKPQVLVKAEENIKKFLKLFIE
jgi:glycosyltransferase involved in cell wall biosynthesis